MILSIAGIIFGVLVALVVVVLLFVLSYVKAGPDTAIMVSGAGKKKILIGNVLRNPSKWFVPGVCTK